eukprot:m.31914 g.31914  ORF g.31914 m.31914 type:complete len:164 (-) comp16551_c0_seq1:380-871(-)
MTTILPKSKWIPDQERPNCHKCERKFDVSHRRHHCRICGEVFCKKCSSKKVATKRVCDGCHPTAVQGSSRHGSTGAKGSNQTVPNKGSLKKQKSITKPKAAVIDVVDDDDEQIGHFSNAQLDFASNSQNNNLVTDGTYLDLEPADMTSHDDGQDLQLQEVDLS